MTLGDGGTGAFERGGDLRAAYRADTVTLQGGWGGGRRFFMGGSDDPSRREGEELLLEPSRRLVQER